MSSTPDPHHHVGRHRAQAPSPFARRRLHAVKVVPTATAAALVLGSAGLALAQQVVLDPPAAQAGAAPASLALSPQQVVAARAEEAVQASVTTDLAARRQATSVQAAASRGRAEAKVRSAVVAKQKAAAAKVARAKQEKTAREARARKAAARARAEREGRRWVRAIRTGRLTSGFGPRWGRTHDGLDIGAPTGTPVYAMSRGTVVLAATVPSFGNKVEIRYWDGTVSWYGHLSRIDVAQGQSVMPGDVVGLVGNTGHSFGSHLHIEVHPRGGDNPVDPAPWLRAHGILLD